jgi:hypothetical protein
LKHCCCLSQGCHPCFRCSLKCCRIIMSRCWS